MALEGYDLVMLGILAGAALLGYFKGMVWQLAWIAGIVASSYDAFLTALSPEDRALELEQPDGRASFEERQQQLAPLFHGMQVAALKVLADDAVELKVLLDFGSPTFHIQPLVRINA